MDPFLQKVHDRPIDGRFTLVKQLGAGGFGVVFLANDLALGREVALKLESDSVYPSFLRDEAQRYELFNGKVGIPQIYWFGYHDHLRVLALELLGPSLEDLFHYCDRRFSLKTTLMIVDQLLVRLETLHGQGVVHRDVKPGNLLLGTGRQGNDIYVIDFGLVDYYGADDDRDETDQSIRSRLIGTARFASVRGHQGRGQSPRDDLESLGYMAVFFLNGQLPWQYLEAENNEEEKRAVMEMKMTTTAHRLCAGLPQEFRQYMEIINRLGHGDLPDYGKIRAMFQRVAARQRLKYDHVYDWTIRDYLENKFAANADPLE